MTSKDPTTNPLTDADVDTLLACLPETLRAALPSFTRVGRGNSGAGVFIVTAASGTAVLKQTPMQEPAEQWRAAVQLQQAAAVAGVAPSVIYTDESRRVVLSERVEDESFPSLYGNPVTRSAATNMLGKAIRAIHNIAAPASQTAIDPVEVLDGFKQAAQQALRGIRLPDVVATAWSEMASIKPPVSDRAEVLCHNDLNPSNIVFDGARLVLLDWQTAAINNPYYDLGTVALFLRMDRDAVLQLLSSYDGVAATEVHPSLVWNRRMAATLSGTAFLLAARSRGYSPLSNAAAHVMSDNTIPTLADFYADLRTGSRTLGSAETQWMFGLVLLNESRRAEEAL